LVGGFAAFLRVNSLEHVGDFANPGRWVVSRIFRTFDQATASVCMNFER
jgi:hypothetical protein